MDKTELLRGIYMGSLQPSEEYPEMDYTQEEWEQRQRLQEDIDLFKDNCFRLGEVFERKNTQYGGAIDYTGVFGACVELLGVVCRLQPMVINAEDFGESQEAAVKNALVDAHNYAVIGLLELEKGNWRGDPINLEILLGRLVSLIEELGRNGSQENS